MRFVGPLISLWLVGLVTSPALARVGAPEENASREAFPVEINDWWELYDQEPVAEQVPTAQPPAPEVEPLPPPAPAPPAAAEPAPGEEILPELLPGENPVDDFSVGEIPAVETVELTAEMARKALDAYVLVREKYKDAELENYDNLQDFVDQNVRGKDFEADIKSFSFNNVNDWNIAITTVGFAFSNITDDQTEDIKLQIEELKQDIDLAQDMRDRMVAALAAMIPSDNNRKIVEDIMKDPAYSEKIKLLETEEE